MASSQFWLEHNGTAGGTPARGLTATTGITSVNWGSQDIANLNIATAVITGGTNSYDKFIALMWSGSWNQLLNARFNSVSGVFGAGITLKATISGSGFYTTPSQATNANLVRDLTSTGLVSTTGLVVPFLSTGSWNNDYNLTATSGAVYNNAGWAGAVAFSPFIITQIVTTVAAAPGNSSSRVFSLVWDEN